MKFFPSADNFTQALLVKNITSGDKGDESCMIFELGEPPDPCHHCGAQLLGGKYHPQARFVAFVFDNTGWFFFTGTPLKFESMENLG